MEAVYFLICIYLSALEIPQCFECLESRLERFLVSESILTSIMCIHMHMIVRRYR